MNESGKKTQAEYMREYRKRNPEKMREIRERYWEKRAKNQGKIESIEEMSTVCDAGKEVDITTSYAVLEIPSQAVELTIQAKVYLNGKIHTVQTSLDFDGIRTAIQEAEDYIGPDDKFVLTEEGERYAKEMGWDG